MKLRIFYGHLGAVFTFIYTRKNFSAAKNKKRTSEYTKSMAFCDFKQLMEKKMLPT